MSLTISGALFTGPFAIDETVVRRNQHPCVYAVVSKEGQAWDPEFRLVAGGESGEDGHDFTTDPRAPEWRQVGSEVSLYLCTIPRDEDPDGERRRQLAHKIAADHASPRDLVGKR